MAEWKKMYQCDNCNRVNARNEEICKGCGDIKEPNNEVFTFLFGFKGWKEVNAKWSYKRNIFGRKKYGWIVKDL